MSQPHLCPRCHGERVVPKAFCPDTSSATPLTRPCPTCRGEGVLWEPPPVVAAPPAEPFHYSPPVYLYPVPVPPLEVGDPPAPRYVVTCEGIGEGSTASVPSVWVRGTSTVYLRPSDLEQMHCDGLLSYTGGET